MAGGVRWETGDGAVSCRLTPPPPLTPPIFPHQKTQFKIAAYVLGPLSLPVGFVAGVVYDPEFRDDVDQRFPEISACMVVCLMGCWWCVCVCMWSCCQAPTAPTLTLLSMPLFWRSRRHPPARGLRGGPAAAAHGPREGLHLLAT